MRPGLKRSKQRDAIMNYLKGTKEHPTADMVYQSVREEFPNISLGTVYRNLSLLEECGEIKKISCDEKSERYDANIMPHYHVFCRCCHKVMDLEMEPLNHINILAESAFDGTVDAHQIYFKGTCKKCLNNLDTK